MAITKQKGDLGEAMIMADVLSKGYKVAMPVGEDWRYDLIVLRKGNLERVQCKYVESDGSTIPVRCKSTNNRLKSGGTLTKKYTSSEVDWMAVFDKTTKQCYYIPSTYLGDGRAGITLRITSSKNNQKKGVMWANDFLEF